MSEDYSVRMGRWTSETVETLSSDAFWGDLFVSHCSRQPLDHLQHWLQKPIYNADRPVPNLVAFVCSKASAFEEEFAAYVDDSAYNHVWSGLLDAIGHRDVPYWIGRAVQITLEAAADYKRRLLIPARRYPFLLMWFVFSPPSVCCDYRKECASDLLSFPSGLIGDKTTLKIRHLFRSDIQVAANTGTVSGAFYKLIYDIASAWELHTQEVTLWNSNSLGLRFCFLAPHLKPDVC